MSETDEIIEQTEERGPAEVTFPNRWEERFQFAKIMWDWWPDHTKMAEFVEFVKLVVG